MKKKIIYTLLMSLLFTSTIYFAYINFTKTEYYKLLVRTEVGDFYVRFKYYYVRKRGTKIKYIIVNKDFKLKRDQPHIMLVEPDDSDFLESSNEKTYEIDLDTIKYFNFSGTLWPICKEYLDIQKSENDCQPDISMNLINNYFRSNYLENNIHYRINEFWEYYDRSKNKSITRDLEFIYNKDFNIVIEAISVDDDDLEVYYKKQLNYIEKISKQEYEKIDKLTSTYCTIDFKIKNNINN